MIILIMCSALPDRTRDNEEKFFVPPKVNFTVVLLGCDFHIGVFSCPHVSEGRTLSSAQVEACLCQYASCFELFRSTYASVSSETLRQPS